MERYAQSETYYPDYQEPDSGVTGVAFGVCRLTDGLWWDFNDSTFKNVGWTTQYQAMAEDENGLWIYTTGWAIPNANAAYKIQYEVTDATGTFYAVGKKLVVNDTLALSVTAIANLEKSAGTIVSGAAAAGTLSTTQMTTDLTEATNDHYNGRIIIWTSGVLQNQATNITDYDGATKMLTYTATTEAPTAADTFIIV